VGTRARIAALHAEEARLLAEASRIAREQIDGIDTVISRVKDTPWRSMAAQVAAATRISDLAESHIATCHSSHQRGARHFGWAQACPERRERLSTTGCRSNSTTVVIGFTAIVSVLHRCLA
jgi:hypothetical protein